MVKFLKKSKVFQYWPYLLGLFIIALILRVSGINFGLPYSYHYDEHFYINTALKLGAGILHNPPYAPTGLSNILAFVYGIYFLIGKVTGLFASAQAFEAAFRADPSAFYLLARLVSAILGAATVSMLYYLGRIVGSPLTGLVAGGLLAVSFLHVRGSHHAVPDVAMTAFVVMAVTLAVAGTNSNQRRYIYAAGLAGGLAMAMKWTALPVALAIGWAALWIDITTRRESTRWIGVTPFLSALFFFLGFAIGSPQILINPMPYINEAFGQYGAGQTGGFEIWQVDTLPGWLFYAKTLLQGMGPVLLILGTIGIVWRLIRIASNEVKLSVLILLFPLTYYLLMGSTRHYFVRYSLPLEPFVALFAAESLVLVGTYFQKRQPWLRFAIAALLVLALVQPLTQSIRHNLLLSQQDTRTLAKQWIETNIPADAKIAVDWLVHTPPLSTAERSMPYSEKIYDLFAVGGSGLFEHPTEWYQQEGFDYLIASSFIYEIPLVVAEQNTQRRVFYSTLDQEMELVKVFIPHKDINSPPFVFDEIYGPIVGLWQREQPGPTLKIYKVTADEMEVSTSTPIESGE